MNEPGTDQPGTGEVTFVLADDHEVDELIDALGRMLWR
jgi:hypothetical protein